MLCKCSGKYIDIYFILKITFFFLPTIFTVCYMPCSDGHITKKNANVFSACRKRRLQERGRGDWESPPLYDFPQRQHERGGVAGRLTSP